jgi:endonuclease-3
MLMDMGKAVKQLKELEKLGSEKRLAADGWSEDWQTLIATLMSARTTDRKTIPVATELFSKFDTIEKLAKTSEAGIAKIIRPVNFYKTKSKNISNLAKIVMKDFGGKIPREFDKLTGLPGVGRKTANVFLAELGEGTIGVDTHVGYISKKMGWTEHEEQEKVEEDLKALFPEKLWGKINWVLVRFGQTYRSRKEKDALLEEIRNR